MKPGFALALSALTTVSLLMGLINSQNYKYTNLFPNANKYKDFFIGFSWLPLFFGTIYLLFGMFIWLGEL